MTEGFGTIINSGGVCAQKELCDEVFTPSYMHLTVNGDWHSRNTVRICVGNLPGPHSEVILLTHLLIKGLLSELINDELSELIVTELRK